MKALCNPPVPFSEMFIEDSEFVNFRDNYSTDPMFSKLDSTICTDNNVFKASSLASEATAAHFLRNTKCTNCDQDGKMYLVEPDPNERGWFGGCGNMDCSGQENIMI